MRNLCDTIFYMETNVLQDFHICISVPLKKTAYLHKIKKRQLLTKKTVRCCKLKESYCDFLFQYPIETFLSIMCMLVANIFWFLKKITSQFNYKLHK